ncbi:MAG: hypothetical protein EHM64_07040 [Ignavibacteriae bacterium]|nr:MAG: hypothetical protein EHM64_07040 [Ignavibacteriota bacterium]
MQREHIKWTMSDKQIYLAIICLGIALYGKSIFFDYTNLDDTMLLVANQAFLGDIGNLSKMFTTDVFISGSNPQTYYRPLMNILFMFEAQIAQDRPLLYHVTNILLHIGCSLLVYVFFRQLKFSRNCSALSAAVFCVHPLQTSAVVWIPGRNDTLLALFILSSFLFFLRAHEVKRTWMYAVHLGLFFCALLVKESAIVLPFLCIGYITVVKREKVQRGVSISVGAGYVLAIASWFMMRNLVSHGYEIHNAGNTLAVNWFNNLPAFFLYIGKIFIPINFSVFPNLADHSIIPGIFCVLLIAGLLYILQPASLKLILWGLFWFFLFLAPSLSGEAVFYSHRMYCSMVGFLIAGAAFLEEVPMKLPSGARVAGAVTILLGLSAITFFQENVFRGRESYANNAYDTAPSVDKSYVCMAGMYLDQRNEPAAEEVLLAELKRKPSASFAHRMLGDIYTNRRTYDLAVREYELALRFDPLDRFAYIHYGILNLELGRVDAAVQLWKTTIQINPDFLLGYYYLANCYVRTKNDPDSAMIYVRELQKRGEPVLPDLLKAIESHPLYKKTR